MKLSKNGRKVLHELEGVSANAYHDPAGYRTIGVGHKITKKETESGYILVGSPGWVYEYRLDWRTLISLIEAECLLDQDLRPFEYFLNMYIVSAVKLNQNQYDALVCFIFNIGHGNFRNSRIYNLLREGKLDKVPAVMEMWKNITVDGFKQESKGLVSRRGKEIALFNTPVNDESRTD